MVGRGDPIRRIDAVAKDFGMAVDSGHPMGPLELLDLIGLPVAMHVLTSLAVLGSRIESRDMLLRDFLPEKASADILEFRKRESTGASTRSQLSSCRTPSDAAPVTDDMLHQRLFLPMVDEAVRCLTDKIVEHPWQVDFALTYGIGFPAFRGGLLTWARHRWRRRSSQRPWIHCHASMANASSLVRRLRTEDGSGRVTSKGARHARTTLVRPLSSRSSQGTLPAW